MYFNKTCNMVAVLILIFFATQVAKLVKLEKDVDVYQGLYGYEEYLVD